MNNEDISRASERSRQVNKTYVVSAALSKSGNGLQTTPYHGRLTLQRRSRRKTGSERTFSADNNQSSTPATVEKRLTLQRRTKTPSSMDKSATRGARLSTHTPAASKVLSEPNGRTTSLLRSVSMKETAKISGRKSGSRVETRIKSANGSTPLLSAVKNLDDDSKCFKTPSRKTPFEKIAAKRDMFEKLAAKEAPRQPHVKTTSLERSNSRVQHNGDSKPVPSIRERKVSSSVVNLSTATSNLRGDAVRASTSTPAPATLQQPLSRPSEVAIQPDSLKMENSAVTVAVRARPFSAREKTEKAQQVIFMKDQETVVHHPVTKQSYTFTYDFSFSSVDYSDSAFASQQAVYETLAKPLLNRAFEGYNTSLFAYGQTGSGKSYTMMGFGDEAGIIPRFCKDLFSQLTSMKSEEVSCHLQMSYFEVYNEKIHDLLITRDDPNNRQMPLRVREHPVHGPYVEELSANVVCCYDDIQSWLQLGNRQRATAATGMNDKSSRSHSVFTLVLTQTKTELVEGEEHDHSITSKINLIDLAGSERCNSAKTSGDRLRVCLLL